MSLAQFRECLVSSLRTPDDNPTQGLQPDVALNAVVGATAIFFVDTDWSSSTLSFSEVWKVALGEILRATNPAPAQLHAFIDIACDCFCASMRSLVPPSMASSFMEFITTRRHTASVIQHGAVSHVQPNQYAGAPSALAPAPLEWPVGQPSQPAHSLAATLATLAARAGQASGVDALQHEAAAPASDAGTTPMIVPPIGTTTQANTTAVREELDDMSASSAAEIVDASSEQGSGSDSSADSEDESRASGRGRTMADLPSESDFDNDSDGSEEYVQRKPRRRPSTPMAPTPPAPKPAKTPRQPSPQSGTKRRRSSSSVFNRVMKAWAATQISQLRPAPAGWEELERMTELIEYAQTGSGQQRLVLPPDLSWARCFEARARRFGVTGLFHPFLRLSGAKKFITSKPAFEQLEYAKQWGDCLYILCRWKPVVGGKVQPLLLSEPPVLFQRSVIRAALQRDNVLHLWPSLFDPEPGVPPTPPIVLPGLAGELSDKLRQAEDAPPGSSSAR